jgi:hypothetical protein
MKIISSQCLLAQTVVTACGHVEEGARAAKLLFEVREIRIQGDSREKTRKCEIVKYLFD